MKSLVSPCRHFCFPWHGRDNVAAERDDSVTPTAKGRDTKTNQARSPVEDLIAELDTFIAQPETLATQIVYAKRTPNEIMTLMNYVFDMMAASPLQSHGDILEKIRNLDPASQKSLSQVFIRCMARMRAQRDLSLTGNQLLNWLVRLQGTLRSNFVATMDAALGQDTEQALGDERSLVKVLQDIGQV